MHIENKLDELGFVLPEAPEPPPGFQFAFEWVRIRGSRLYASGHSAQLPDGSFAGPFGKVPSQVSADAACDAARLTALSMLGSIKRAIGDLDRIGAWLMVNGMVNADNGFPQSTVVINGFSDFVTQLFGPEVGGHARTAVGYAGLPMNNAVVVSAELEILPD
ncbi:RidA family protein [Antrihabitans cavernicola]|uniref:RidA family protein n=1 Tax=Antrihabitans cavernicola TaxID=2495913 RepID=A0A5A7S9C7_9NOCA|nr:RidA family protein [Spelaeibacter cavernicola]KAA0022506.1 RidA family protein [Spelaeibacter cavernicola]